MNQKTLLKDGMRFESETEAVVFNHYSFCELVKRIMVKYGGLTYDDATKKLSNSFLVDIPKSSDEVEYLGHELEYHWAMLITHGDMYWTKGIPSDFNEFETEYLQWEAKTKLKFNLKNAFEYDEH